MRPSRIVRIVGLEVKAVAAIATVLLLTLRSNATPAEAPVMGFGIQGPDRGFFIRTDDSIPLLPRGRWVQGPSPWPLVMRTPPPPPPPLWPRQRPLQPYPHPIFAPPYRPHFAPPYWR